MVYKAITGTDKTRLEIKCAVIFNLNHTLKGPGQSQEQKKSHSSLALKRVVSLERVSSGGDVGCNIVQK